MSQQVDRNIIANDDELSMEVLDSVCGGAYRSSNGSRFGVVVDGNVYNSRDGKKYGIVVNGDIYSSRTGSKVGIEVNGYALS